MNAVVGPDSQYPRLVPVPPSTDNPAADCLSIAFDGEMPLHLSPHIMRNIARVLRSAGVGQEAIGAYLDLLGDVVAFCGGSVTEPPRSAHDSRDHEDNLILDLAHAVEAEILVTDDTDLTPLSPWRGISILRPHEFVRRVVGARRGR